MTDLTDRMRTCAAYIMERPRGEPMPTDRAELDVVLARIELVLDDAAALLIEAADALVIASRDAVLGDPMEIIEPPPAGFTIDRTPSPMWTAPGDTLPVANPYRSQNACPTCDSRAPKRVRRAGKSLVFVCPVCGLITKKPPADGTAGGKE